VTAYAYRVTATPGEILFSIQNFTTFAVLNDSERVVRRKRHSVECCDSSDRQVYSLFCVYGFMFDRQRARLVRIVHEAREYELQMDTIVSAREILRD